MKAVRLIEYEKPLAMQEIPIPGIGTQDVLVRVKAAGICHSDVHYRSGKPPLKSLPLTLGHEVSGSDQAASALTAALAAEGAGVSIGHSAGNIAGA